ncbi:MAG: TetR/AcrR family transcriptional regulator [Chloroflexota bacterium]
MLEAGPRRGRAHDAEGARAAILDAAEEAFAEHGFDGARVDAIAAGAGYNKSLIFQYFGDKLNLYTEVIKRAQRETNELRARGFAQLLDDETIATDAHRFKTLLETAVRGSFDYLVERPRLMRILLWEMADGWQTLAKISPQFPKEHIDRFEMLVDKARRAGLLRSGFAPLAQLSVPLQMCQSYLAYLPWFQLLLPGEDLSSAAALARSREFLVAFVVAGIMVDAPETGPQYSEGGVRCRP